MWPVQIDPLIAIGVVAATAATDAVYVMFTASVAARRRVPAARWRERCRMPAAREGERCFYARPRSAGR